MSLKHTIDMIESNSLVKLEYAQGLQENQVDSICTALKGNTSVTQVILANTGITDAGAVKFAEVIKTTKTIQKLDLGYNKIYVDGMVAIGEALAVNESIEECKLHRQEKDCGPAAEAKVVNLWETNTTLCRLYCTLHDRKYNGDNTRGEVRNKEIARRKAKGLDYMDLDPARRDEYIQLQAKKRKEEAEAKAAANAPITAKVESTGGPYTYKQLTADAKYRPDDVDALKRESYLSDAEFQEVFGMERAAFDKLAGWKKNNLKKDKNLR